MKTDFLEPPKGRCNKGPNGQLCIFCRAESLQIANWFIQIIRSSYNANELQQIRKQGKELDRKTRKRKGK